MRPTPTRNAYVPEPPAKPVVSVSRKHHFWGGTPRIWPFEMGSQQIVREALQIHDAYAAVAALPFVEPFGFVVNAVRGRHLFAVHPVLREPGWGVGV